MADPIYLDYNATTPLDPRVFEVMKEWYLGPPSNSGSRTHAYGQRARDAVERARTQIAEVIDAKPEEIIFTSGATESNNLAIIGLAEHGEATGKRHIVSTTIEHKAVIEPLQFLAKRGFEIEFAPVCKGGYVDAQDIVKRVRKDTLLVSVMHANNETGILQPVGEIGQALQNRKTLFHIDAAQTFGKEADLADVEFDLLSTSSHKIYGPQGIGALVLKRRGNALVPLTCMAYGGGQERGVRPGTLPVALAVGFGKAAELASLESLSRNADAELTKQRIIESLVGVDFQINGDLKRSQPHVINICFPGVDSEALMLATRDLIAFSNGSACTSTSYSPSHVLKAMGMDDTCLDSSVRLSWGPGVSFLPIDEFLVALQSLQM